MKWSVGASVLVFATALSAASCANQNGAGGNGTPSSSVAIFTMDDASEHDVCGIGLILKFIPATASSSTADEAVLQFGPVSHVADNVQNHTGDMPLPANAAQLLAGKTVTLGGHSFKVDSIDVQNSKATLEATC